MTPIWQDYFLEIDETSQEYIVKVSGVEVYHGRAVAEPGQSSLAIRLNDIAADYLRSSLPPLTADGYAEESGMTVTLEVYDPDDTLLGSETFSYEWTYDEDASGASAPITDRVAASQPLFFSKYGTGAVAGSIDGGAITLGTSSSKAGTAVLMLGTHAGAKAVTLGGNSFRVVDGCHRYCLLYVNALGGWDSLLLEGHCARKDTVTRHISEKVGRGRDNYANEVRVGWTLRTGLLSDDEAGRMWHLLESTDVYLYDLATARCEPVVLTDSECEFMTYRGNGGRRSQYTINAELSNDWERR